MINYGIEHGKACLQCKGQSWWRHTEVRESTLLWWTALHVAAQGWHHTIIWYNAALITTGSYKIACVATWRFLIGFIVRGCRGPCLQKLYTASLDLVSRCLSKWVWAWKHAFPCSDCVVVVVSAALKIKERAVLQGNAHFEETLQRSRFFHRAQIDAFAGMRAFSGMHDNVCTLVRMHKPSLSISFKWGISSHGNQISSRWSRGTCHKMGNI